MYVHEMNNIDLWRTTLSFYIRASGAVRYVHDFDGLPQNSSLAFRS